MYVAGSWGRFNFGAEDGAAYLLQVAAPSADSNFDGLRQYVDAVNYAGAPTLPVSFAALANVQWDYAQDLTKASDKLTYITPSFNGFQAGLSYTPDVVATDFSETTPTSAASRTLAGNGTDDVAGDYGSAWDVALRYEGQFDSFGLTAGAGYTHVDLEEDNAGVDDVTAWNVGAAVTVGAFGLGVIYTENDQGTDPERERDTWVVGADYTTGPFKVGGSWYSSDHEDFNGGTTELDTDRYTGGVTYTYGPGMTFRGSLSYIDHELGAGDMDATTLLLGTQVNF